MNLSEITVREINPYIRFMSFGSFDPHATMVSACDHRLVFFLSGPHSAVINNENITIEKNMMIIIKPGAKYRFYKNSHDTNAVIMNFDYTQNHNNITKSIFPIPSKVFDSNNIIENTKFIDCSLLNNIFFLKNADYFLNSFKMINEEYEAKRIYYEEKASAIFKNILIGAIRSEESYNKNANRITDTLIKYIQDHYSEDISNEKLGKLVGYHPYYINRIMLKSTGMTLRQYLINYRMERAKKLLINTEYTINEVSEMCGFKTISYFSRLFKEKCETTPMTFRKNNRNYI